MKVRVGQGRFLPFLDHGKIPCQKEQVTTGTYFQSKSTGRTKSKNREVYQVRHVN